MSDDSVEFGGFGPTTPAHPSMKPKAKARVATGTGNAGAESKSTKQIQMRTASGGNDREPGPSKQRTTGDAPGRAPKRRKQQKDVAVDNGGYETRMGAEAEQAEEERIIVDDVVATSDEDEVQAEVMTKVNGNGKQKGRANGRSTQQKGKLPPRPEFKKAQEVQASEEEEGGGEGAIPDGSTEPSGRNGRGAKAKAVGGRGKTQAKRAREENTLDLDDSLEGHDAVAGLIEKVGRAGANTGSSLKADAKKDAELARLREQVNQLQKENQTLTNQMEELFRVRETEVEALLQNLEERYEAKIRAAEEVTQALTEQLTKKQPLAGTGKSSILHLITREAAEEERQGLDKEIAKLKSDLDDTLKKLASKDKIIEELNQTEKDLKTELKAEIERASALAKHTPRHPQPTPHHGTIAEDPKHREAIRIYEDLTNIIIPNIRSSPGASSKDEWIFTCCYTHTNESDSVNATTYSISFTLRSYEDTSEGVFTDWIQYLPVSLEKESPDFVEKLGFLNAAFQFERNQLALFLRTLYTTVEGIVKAAEDDEDEEMGED
ncbi:hypothetical protein P691DRAFT_775094 [Macrolepiota fuliginosa MF-IS2]|uniref:Monopolin complex subunit Csm1/Pcs1 C-terminal domain-containing protein n=1 Tax=Macrolepiota fuliginosa MF-IS2 TaxID=1400762 RepID=A0A9P6C550_9AGAR|nr:hypothetical protein P691DRAFT_775094 [Macrolepiota fuliginosa MF-IS2]